MLDEKAAQRKRDAFALRRASVPERASRYVSESLFDQGALFVTEELRSYARTAYRNLLQGLAERFCSELSRMGTALAVEDVVASLENSPLDVSPDLASALYHRAEEARLSRRLLSIAESAFLVGQAEDPEMLASAWARDDRQLSARHETYDRLREMRLAPEGGPTLLLDELGERLAEDLVWRVAGRFAVKAVDGGDIGDDQSDFLAAVERAATGIAGEVDVVRSIQHAAMMLAARVEERGHLGDWLVLKALFSGDVIFAVALVAVRARLSSGTAWLLLIRNMRVSAAYLLRGAGFADAPARQILQLLYQASGEEPDGQKARAAAERDFAAADAQDARESLAFWGLDSRLRSAFEGD